MKVSHVLFKTNDLKKTIKEFEKSGFKVEYGSKKKPHNALIYFSEGPYIEILEKAPITSLIKSLMKCQPILPAVSDYNDQNIFICPLKKIPTRRLVFSFFIRLRARIIVAFFHANTSAEIITPAITAIARSTYTVIADTAIKTKASANGILFMIRKLDQANVPTTTINITPTSAANGICSIKGAANKIKINKNNAAAIPATRVRPPDFTLIIDWPIMAQPPMPPNASSMRECWRAGDSRQICSPYVAKCS